MTVGRWIDRSDEETDARLWREESRRAGRSAPHSFSPATPSQVRHGVGLAMLMLLALVGAAVTIAVLRVLWIAGRWVWGSLMPHYMQVASLPQATQDVARATVALLRWALGAR